MLIRHFAQILDVQVALPACSMRLHAVHVIAMHVDAREIISFVSAVKNVLHCHFLIQ